MITSNQGGPSLCCTRGLIKWIQNCLASLIIASLFTIVISLQFQLNQKNDRQLGRTEILRMLPRGEILRPALLGFRHLAADLFWLRIVQILGERTVSDRDYEWLFHALDVVTTLDPQYSYAYDAGGTILAELAHRVDWSNQLLEKGLHANPTSWRIPFVLGFNCFFHLNDYVRAAEYMGQAAKIPGRPFYVDTLAARLYVEGGSPRLALSYLESMIHQTEDQALREIYSERYKEVLIVRDLQVLEHALERYRNSVGTIPHKLTDLVTMGFLLALPDEPFGGEYQLDTRSGEVRSSTHPERLRLHRPGGASRVQKSI